MASGIRALASLPLGSSDFASACMTAHVRRAHLTLIVVRIVGTNQGGAIVPEQCYSASCLFDSRHKLSAFCTAIQSTVEASVPMIQSKRVQLFTRIPSNDSDESDVPCMLSVRPGGRSVNEEMTVHDGVLRTAVHVSGAMRAWQRQCSIRSNVCIREAVAGWERYIVEKPKNGITHAIAMGLEKLTGGGRPTKTVPEVCVCTEAHDCDCFMRRAMYRAGTTWVTVYAVMPPHTFIIGGVRKYHLEPTHKIDEMIPMWISRLVNEDESESEATTVFASIRPLTWPTDMPMIMRVCWEEDSANSSDATLSASESLTSFSNSPFNMLETSFTTSILELGTMWASCQPHHTIVSILKEASHTVGPYYGPQLRYVIGLSNGPTWSQHLLRRAKSLGKETLSNIDLYNRMRRHENSTLALISVLRHVTAPERIGIGTLEACQHTGYAAAVIVLVMYCMNTHAHVPDPASAVIDVDVTEITKDAKNMWQRCTLFDT